MWAAVARNVLPTRSRNVRVALAVGLQLEFALWVSSVRSLTLTHGNDRDAVTRIHTYVPTVTGATAGVLVL